MGLDSERTSSSFVEFGFESMEVVVKEEEMSIDLDSMCVDSSFLVLGSERVSGLGSSWRVSSLSGSSS